MSADRQSFLDNFLNQTQPVQVYLAEVVSVETTVNRCTVRILSSDLEVDNVTLVAEEDGESWICITPKVGSLVLVGCVENEISDMYLVQYGDIERGEILIGQTKVGFDKSIISIQNSNSSVVIDENKVSVTQGQTVIELKNGKISLKNGSVGLKDIFDDLATLIQNLKVVTAQGPSTALTPDTIASLTSFKAKYPQLLA